MILRTFAFQGDNLVCLQKWKVDLFKAVCHDIHLANSVHNFVFSYKKSQIQHSVTDTLSSWSKCKSVWIARCATSRVSAKMPTLLWFTRGGVLHCEPPPRPPFTKSSLPERIRTLQNSKSGCFLCVPGACSRSKPYAVFTAQALCEVLSCTVSSTHTFQGNTPNLGYFL